MSEADFCGMDAGEYYATKDFLDRERFHWKQEMEEQMKNRVTVRHGMLSDLKTYLKQSGWKLEEPVGAYEVLRARNPNYPRPLLVHDRAERGVGYSIDERDVKVQRLATQPPQAWHRPRLAYTGRAKPIF